MDTTQQKYTIAIVDDDPFLLDMYTHKFQEQGFHVVPFNESARFLEKCKDTSFSPDLILLDLMMPHLNGFEVMEEIQKEKLVAGARVVVLSNLGEATDKARADSLGAGGYIVKASATPSEVVGKVTALLSEK